jgi:hypothetical protein
MTRTPKAAALLGACLLTAVVVALVLGTRGRNHSPAPAGFGQVGNQAACGSQVGLGTAQRRYRLCLSTHPLSSLSGQSQVGREAPRGRRLHWVVAQDVSVIGA